YRIFLHPLSRFPGPVLARFTDWYGGSQAMRRRMHVATFLDHTKYGPVVRQGPNKLVFNSLAAQRDIYLNERLRKSRNYSAVQLTSNPNILTVIDKHAHRTKRKIIGQALADKYLRKFEPLLIEHADTFVEQLLKSAGNVVDMSEYCKRFSFDVIGRLGFGSTWDTQSSKKNRWLIPTLGSMIWRTNNKIQFPGLTYLFLQWLPHVIFNRLRFIKFLLDIIKARAAEDTHAKDDFFSFVVDAKDPETGVKMTTSELWEEAIFLLPAGTRSDTTSATITAVFFYLSRYPACYTRLCEEIRTSFTTAESIRSGPTLASCTYLRACIDETLRISTPATGTMWRELDAKDKDPVIIDGTVVPPGTQVCVNLYCLHHNSDYFPKPFTFIPERWLMDPNDTEEAKASKKLMREAFVPFSIGTRACAGKSIAYSETSLAVAKTLWSCDIERPAGPADELGEGGRGKGAGRERKMELQLYDQFISTVSGPNLIVRPRNKVGKDGAGAG
ncbi:benzoate 4-monooxygenase cytochrome P450, partial [Lophiostoma macrostomum CBS 122681]